MLTGGRRNPVQPRPSQRSAPEAPGRPHHCVCRGACCHGAVPWREPGEARGAEADMVVQKAQGSCACDRAQSGGLSARQPRATRAGWHMRHSAEVGWAWCRRGFVPPASAVGRLLLVWCHGGGVPNCGGDPRGTKGSNCCRVGYVVATVDPGCLRGPQEHSVHGVPRFDRGGPVVPYSSDMRSRKTAAADARRDRLADRRCARVPPRSYSAGSYCTIGVGRA